MSKIMDYTQKMRKYFIIYAFIAAVCCSITLVSVTSANKFIFFRIISIASIIEVTAFLWINLKKRGQLLNPEVLFVVFLFVFNFGQVVLLAFFSGAYERILTFNVIELVTFDKYTHALRLINCSFALICLGVLFPYKSKVNVTCLDPKDELWNCKQTYKYAVIILIATFPIKIVIDMWQLYLAATQGAVVAREAMSSIPDFVVTYSNFAIIGFVLLLFSTQRTKKRIKILILEVVYYCITMLVGRRSEIAVSVCVLFVFFLIASRKRMKFTYCVALIIIAYLFATLLYTVVYMRVNHGNSMTIGVFLESFYHCLLKENIIFEVLREYGNTGYTAIMVIENWLPQYGPAMGESYYFGIFPVFFNISGIAGELTVRSRFTLHLVESGVLNSQYLNIGGSLIGELFYNFGCVGGLVASIFCGCGVGYIFHKAQEYCQSHNYIKLACCVIPIIAVIYSVRSEFYYMIRDVVWGVLFVVITALLFCSRGRRLMRKFGDENDKCNSSRL